MINSLWVMRKVYNTAAGKKAWSWFCNFCHRPIINKILLKAVNEKIISDQHTREQTSAVLMKQEKHALFVFPYFVENAATQYIRYIANTFRELGYVVHGLQYNNNLQEIDDPCFDVVDSLRAEGNFRDWNIHKKNKLFQRNELDDWVEEGLLDFVERLNQQFKFKICIVDYVFLSAVFNVFPKDTLKILITNDVFAERNKKLDALGIDPIYFDFSVSETDEKKGIKRADYVIAIQEKEGEYFRKLTEEDNVFVVPYIPNENFRERKPDRQNIPVVGFFASGHHPNVVAIREFVKAIRGDEFKLLIGGSICSELSDFKENSLIKIIGTVKDIDEFYDQCDIVINPDTVESGFKIKCIEACSRGIPLVCTRAASIGLPGVGKYQSCSSAEDCCRKVQEIISSSALMKEQSEQSRNIYLKIIELYSAYEIFNNLVNCRGLRIIKKRDRANPIISIIVPVYRVERYIHQAMNSLINQTLKNIEIIVVDDGSPDRCGEILDEYAVLDNRVKVIHQENGGYGKAVNAGLEVASGEYIGILEPDDWIDEKMYEDLWNVTASGDKIVKGGFFKHRTAAAIEEIDLFKSFSNNHNDEVVEISTTRTDMMLCESSIWSAIYQRDFLVKNKIKMMTTPGASYQDVPWKFMTYSSASTIKLCRFSHYHYRVLTSNSSSKNNKWNKAFLENYKSIIFYLKERQLFEKQKNNVSAHFYVDLNFHENRLINSEKEKFYNDVKSFLEANKADFIPFYAVIFPEKMEPWVLMNVYPLYKRITRL